MTDKKHTRWLQHELPQWVQQHLISTEQAQQISRYYQQEYQPEYRQPAGSHGGRAIFSVMGAILFGLGIILFFAYNWADMHRYIKLLVIFGFIIAANLGALWFDAPARRQCAASEGLALLGTMLFGAAIWLISQIYHIDEHYPNAFFLWGLAALAMGWARQSAVQCLAAIVLLFSWGSLETFNFDHPFHSSPWWLLAGAAPLAWRLRSAPLLFVALSAFYLLWIMTLTSNLEAVAGYVGLAVAVVLIQAGMFCERSDNTRQWPARVALAVPGFLAYMGLVFALTFVHFVDKKHSLELFDTAVKTGFFWASLLISIAVSLLALPGMGRASESDRIHTVLLLATLAITFLVGPGWLDLSYGILSGIMNLIFISHCFLFILHGSQQQRGWEVAGGCLLFAILVFARYSDLFDSLLSRSLVFLILGASLFVVGNFYARHKQDHGKTVIQGGNG